MMVDDDNGFDGFDVDAFLRGVPGSTYRRPPSFLGQALVYALPDKEKYTMGDLPIDAKRKMLEAEAKRHQAKADAARLHLEALEAIPSADPFPNSTVLRVATVGGQSTFVLFKVNGRWYSTGRTGPHRASWPDLIEWLVNRGVRMVHVYQLDESYPIGQLPTGAPDPVVPEEPGLPSDVKLLSVKPCPREDGHSEHAHRLPGVDGVFWCYGNDVTR